MSMPLLLFSLSTPNPFFLTHYIKSTTLSPTRFISMAPASISRKRCVLQLNELNQDLLEEVLSWLPTSSFFRVTSVCKRWKSVADSTTFRRACTREREREPWFYMVDYDGGDDDSLQESSLRPVIFDSSEKKWKRLKQRDKSFSDFIPVAASGGLICFHHGDGDFAVNSPVNDGYRRIESFPSGAKQRRIRAIAMISKQDSFKLVVVSGELTNLTFREYDSISDQWGDENSLTREVKAWEEGEEQDEEEDCARYFLSKSGNVVSTDFRRSPSKKYSAILTIENEDEILHFLSSSGSIIACNLTRRRFFIYPKLLPSFSEYSIDLVECSGKMHVVLLSEFLEMASLRLWDWDDFLQRWRQTAAMPPSMSHEFSGKNVDVNCTGFRRKILICAKSTEICGYYLCDLDKNEWVELPEFEMNGERREFVSAFSLEPRIGDSIHHSRVSSS